MVPVQDKSKGESEKLVEVDGEPKEGAKTEIKSKPAEVKLKANEKQVADDGDKPQGDVKKETALVAPKDEKKTDKKTSEESFLTSAASSALHASVMIGSGYLICRCGFSVAWLLVGVCVYVVRDGYKKNRERRKATIRAAVSNEKAAVLARIEDLPSWVFFPDVERAEWLNKMIHQLWPYIGGYVQDLLTSTIMPAVRENLPGYLKDLKLQKIELGEIPPRIGGIKVYREHVARDEIIMDLDVIYSGDCHFEVKVKKLVAGIRDFQFQGKMRVVMKPLVKKIPLVAAVNVFFLKAPDFDFNLTNLADFLDLPGFNELLRSGITDQINAFAVLPNKITVALIDDIDAELVKFVLPVGLLRIQIRQAKNLVKSDVGMLGMGKSDPYAVVNVGANAFKTATQNSTINPIWNFACEVLIYQIHGQNLEITVYDEDPGSKDDFLGKVSQSVYELAKRGSTDRWLKLEDVPSGRIYIKTSWLEFSEKPEDLNKALTIAADVPSKSAMSSAVLLVFIDSCRDLPHSSKAASEPSPQVVLGVGNTARHSVVKPNTSQPVFEETFAFLLYNPEVQELKVEVKDTKSQKVLGYVMFQISRLLKEEGLTIKEPFLLHGCELNSKIKMTLILKILAQPQSEERLSEDEGDLSGTESASRPGSPQLQKQIPSLDEMVRNTVTPAVAPTRMSKKQESADSPTRTSQISTKPDTPQIQLTFRYSTKKSKLVVTVHKIESLYHENGAPDTYVKLYLLPDRSSDTKRKTQVVKGSLVPVFEESFEYDINQVDLVKYSLEVTVCVKHFHKQKVLAETYINFSDYDIKTKDVTAWFTLERREE